MEQYLKMLCSTNIAAGFSHSAAISKQGDLYVWGSNENERLYSKSKEANAQGPQQVTLKYKNMEYKARSIVAGQNTLFVIANNKQRKQISRDDDELAITDRLKEILLEEGTLAYFFGLLRKRGTVKQGGNLLNKMQVGEDDDSGEEESSQGSDYAAKRDEDSIELDERLNSEQAETLLINRNDFIQIIEKAQLTQKKSKIHFLADRLIEERKKYQEDIVLGDIEDFCLGYRQHQQKLFAFGQGHSQMFAFQRNQMNEDSQMISEDESDIDEKWRKNLMKSYQKEIIVVPRPTVIKFPKHTMPIMQIACGFSHILAISEDFQLFSWGEGSKGQLGFGSRYPVHEPTRLVIKKKGFTSDIGFISAGKFHSMVVSLKKKVFVWGEGVFGKLGLDHEDDILVPTENEDLSRLRVEFLACGESHSAAISDKLKLYTWGNGSYGRLGHGMDQNEKRPKVVVDMEGHESVYVSCGAFHTFALSSEGHVYAFGQGKHGKLGVSRQDKEMKVVGLPERIGIYRQVDQGQDIITDKQEIVQIVASFNHSIALGKSGKVYTWGYNGKDLLGRKKGYFENVPVDLDQFIAKVPKSNEIIQKKEQKEEEVQNIEVLQVGCASMNTVCVTNTGEVYVLGSNTYGQHGRPREERPSRALKGAQRKELDANTEGATQQQLQDYMSLIKFPSDSKVKILSIAAGGEHIFAVSSTQELYGWGKNKEGQLGIGSISEYEHEPTLVRKLESIVQAYCGDNYSACVSAYGEVYVTGSLEGGKLGLGNAYTDGYLLDFTLVPNIPPIASLACGPNHMLAIAQWTKDKAQDKDGMLYAWGLNSRGQLGIGDKEDVNVPHKILNSKVLFRKVVAGQNFSMAISNSNQLYFWGNFKYMCDTKVTKDLEEPTFMKSFEKYNVRDIAVCYKKCIIINDKGEIIVWGDYLKNKFSLNFDPNKEEEPKKQSQFGKTEITVKQIQPFPAQGKFDTLMGQISTGPSHSAGVSVKRSLYTWGYNDSKRLGLPEKDQAYALKKPVLVQYLNELMLKAKENNKNDGLKEQEEEDEDDQQEQTKSCKIL